MRLKTHNGRRPCGACGQSYPATERHFYRKNSGGWSSECRPCFRARSSANQKARHHAGGAVYHLAYIIRSARFRARKFRLAFDIDAEFLGVLLTGQRGRCALTGVELTFTKGEGHVPTNASIDRMDPALGYSRANVHLVAHQVNTMKSNLSLPALAEWCRLVLDRCTRPARRTTHPTTRGRRRSP